MENSYSIFDVILLTETWYTVDYYNYIIPDCRLYLSLVKKKIKRRYNDLFQRKL